MLGISKETTPFRKVDTTGMKISQPSEFILRLFLLVFLGSVIPACTGSPEEQSITATGIIDSETPSASLAPDLPDLGLAPELSNNIWLNVNEPLRIADLAGKVILLDFWTFG
jgi:hypothetical protein